MRKPRPAAAAVLALCVAALMPAPLAAQEAGGLAHTRALPGGVAMVPAAEQADWTAIGRLNGAGFRTRRMCTATLIAPDRVLTAAHCTLRADGTPARPERLIFVAGWRAGNAAASGVGARVTRHAGFRPRLPARATDVASDLAIVHLATPIAGLRPLALAEGDALAGPLEILGYRGDRPHVLHRHAPCPLRARDAGALALGCAVVPGTSGAPVLARTAAGPAIVGIVSGRGPLGTLAARPDAWAPARP